MPKCSPFTVTNNLNSFKVKVLLCQDEPKDHHLNKLCLAHILTVTYMYKTYRVIGPLVLEKTFE